VSSRHFALPCTLALTVLTGCPAEEPPVSAETETETETGPPPSCLDTDTPGEDIIINSDADMEELALSGCVPEHVIVSGGAVTSLAGLSELREVGILDLRFNPVLDSFVGIEGLERVDHLIITGDNKVANLPEFPNLVVGRLTIASNEILEDLGGFPAVTSLTRLEIDSNIALTDLSGLDALESITGDMLLTNSPIFVDYANLGALISVGGSVDIQDNSELDTLAGLGQLTSIGDGLRIINNPKLSECLVGDFIAAAEIGGAVLFADNQSDLCD